MDEDLEYEPGAQNYLSVIGLMVNTPEDWIRALSLNRDITSETH